MYLQILVYAGLAVVGILALSFFGVVFGWIDLIMHPAAYPTPGARRITLLMATFWYVTLPAAKVYGWLKRRRQAELMALAHGLVEDTDLADQVAMRIEMRIRSSMVPNVHQPEQSWSDGTWG